MSYSGDAAEQVVRMSLETGEVAVKLAGSGAKQVAVMLYAILRDQEKTKGKARLTNLLRSGKELKVFAVQDRELKKFCAEAKRYGVLYCVLKDKSTKDGITDILVRAEDASKINRIFERFELATVDKAKEQKNPTQARTEKFPPSEPTFGRKEPTTTNISDRPSVRQMLHEIKERRQGQTEPQLPRGREWSNRETR